MIDYAQIIRIGIHLGRSGQPARVLLDRYPPGSERQAALSGWNEGSRLRRIDVRRERTLEGVK